MKILPGWRPDWIVVFLAVLCAWIAAPPALAAETDPEVTVVLMPKGTELSGLDSSLWSRGLLSAEMGSHSPVQTMLDLGQGARVTPRNYGVKLPRIGSQSIESLMQLASVRAVTASRRIEVGSLRDALERADIVVSLAPDLLVRTAFSSPQHFDRVSKPLNRTAAGSLRVITAPAEQLGTLRSRLGSGDLMIALERPGNEQLLDIAIASSGFTDDLVSPSTHLVPLVSSVDIAPTVLSHLGVSVPESMDGTVITGGESTSFGTIGQVRDRLLEAPDRRWNLIVAGTISILVLFAISALIARLDGLRFAAGLTAAALPLSLIAILVVPRFHPGPVAEVAAVLIFALAGAWLLRGRLGDLPAYVVATGAALGAVAIDLLLGLDLIPFSVLGPDPASGVRFFGVGNQLEAILACCLFLGLSTWATIRPPKSKHQVALIHVIAAVTMMALLVPGRLGADVGAVITFGAGAAAACLVLLGASWRVILGAAVSVPLLLGLFALIDTVTGAGSHFTRTIIDAATPGDAIDSMLSRLRASARTVTSPHYRPYLALVVVASVTLATLTRRLGNPLRRPYLSIGLCATVAALVFGAIGNDSGVRLIVAGAPFVLSWWAMALAQRPTTRSCGKTENSP